MRHINRRRCRPAFGTAAAALFSSLLTVAAAAQAQVTLYDGALNSAPGEQGWLSFVPPGATETVAGGKTTLDTMPAGSGTQAGYSEVTSTRPVSPFMLERLTGYVVRFDVRLVSEAHDNLNRAGFSVIVLGSDKQGIELGFWTNEVWAQSGPDFLHAEGAALNTTSLSGTGQAQTIRYDLSVLGSGYTLAANGTSILSGALRDYSPFGAPYNTANFLFLGDNTTSARGITEIALVSVVAAPEPGAAGLLLLGTITGAGSLIRRRKLSRR